MSSVNGGLNIVKDGLVLYLDAANTKSYINGTIWYDLSRSGSNGTLTNGPSFSSDNYGCILFDGVDDYIDIPNIELNFVNHPITLVSIVKVNTLGSGGGLNIFFSKDRNIPNNSYTIFQINSQDKLRLLLQNGSNSLDFNGDGPALSTGVYHFAVTISSQTITFFVNGAQYGSSFDNINNVLPIYPGNSIGWRINRLNAGGFGDLISNTTVYSAKIYNRSLTPSEILQSYNAIKSRFGL